MDVRPDNFLTKFGVLIVLMLFSVVLFDFVVYQVVIEMTGKAIAAWAATAFLPVTIATLFYLNYRDRERLYQSFEE